MKKQYKQKILVANRSEIACRIFQACRELGVYCLALKTPQDESSSRHLHLADEVHPVASYTDAEAILNIALEAGVQAIHPGYGFLSESASFARKVEAAGLSFIGPRAESIDRLGHKTRAKVFVNQLGIPTLDWFEFDPKKMFEQAQKLGFPLLLKAALGGGGRGIRKISRPEDLKEAVESASMEAQNIFGDGQLFFEKWISRARHIEVQIFGDGEGNGIHLFERDCSLQRRHQKIWEETPAISLSSKTRSALHDIALRVLRAKRYRSAGTLEFLLDEKENFYFLELNPRLQVEHAISEQVTGFDLVLAQLQLAFFPDQLDLSTLPELRGHCIEVRVCAEDPLSDFIPSPALLTQVHWPMGAGIRIESGIEQGQKISADYDSLIGKLIITAPNRRLALNRLRVALTQLTLSGPSLKTNVAYLKALLEQEEVQTGSVDIQFLERNGHKILSKLGQNKDKISKAGIGQELSTGQRLSNQPRETIWQFWKTPQNPFDFNVQIQEQAWEASSFEFCKKKKSSSILSSQSINKVESNEIRATIPGRVRKIFVSPQDWVQEGAVLLVIEAMKMEFKIQAPQEGQVKRVIVQDQAVVSQGDLLFVCNWSTKNALEERK